jgi:hypothetical protein
VPPIDEDVEAPGGEGPDPVAGAFNLVAKVGEETAQSARELAGHSRAASEDRSQGASVGDLMSAGHPQKILGEVEKMSKRLLSAGGNLRKVLVKELTKEGKGVAAISRLFGVSHQRISTLLRSSRQKKK